MSPRRGFPLLGVADRRTSARRRPMPRPFGPRPARGDGRARRTGVAGEDQQGGTERRPQYQPRPPGGQELAQRRAPTSAPTEPAGPSGGQSGARRRGPRPLRRPRRPDAPARPRRRTAPSTAEATRPRTGGWPSPDEGDAEQGEGRRHQDPAPPDHVAGAGLARAGRPGRSGSGRSRGRPPRPGPRTPRPRRRRPGGRGPPTTNCLRAPGRRPAVRPGRGRSGRRRSPGTPDDEASGGPSFGREGSHGVGTACRTSTKTTGGRAHGFDHLSGR